MVQKYVYSITRNIKYLNLKPVFFILNNSVESNTHFKGLFYIKNPVLKAFFNDLLHLII